MHRLYPDDLADRGAGDGRTPTGDGAAYKVSDAERPLPDLDADFRFEHHAAHLPAASPYPNTYAEALFVRGDIELVAAADRDTKRLGVFQQRYNVGPEHTYEDAAEMLRRERPEVVAIATNIAGRADLTCLAVECGAKAIMTEKPMVNTLEEADHMVDSCAEAGVPLCAGAAQADHPSFARAKQLLLAGAIGELRSIEAPAPRCQTQGWSYFIPDGDELAWAVGTGDQGRRESGSDEFVGDGLCVLHRHRHHQLMLVPTDQTFTMSCILSWITELRMHKLTLLANV